MYPVRKQGRHRRRPAKINAKNVEGYTFYYILKLARRIQLLFLSPDALIGRGVPRACFVPTQTSEVYRRGVPQVERLSILRAHSRPRMGWFASMHPVRWDVIVSEGTRAVIGRGNVVECQSQASRTTCDRSEGRAKESLIGGRAGKMGVEQCRHTIRMFLGNV